MRRRFWLKSALALVTGAITVITLLWHDWIEAVTRVDPDKGSGVAEWLTDVTLSIFTSLLAVRAGREWNRARLAES